MYRSPGSRRGLTLAIEDMATKRTPHPRIEADRLVTAAGSKVCHRPTAGTDEPVPDCHHYPWAEQYYFKKPAQIPHHRPCGKCFPELEVCRD